MRTNSSKEPFKEKTEKTSKKNSSTGVIQNFFYRELSEVNFEDRKQALQLKRKENKRILPFVTQFQPSVPNLK